MSRNRRGSHGGGNGGNGGGSCPGSSIAPFKQTRLEGATNLVHNTISMMREYEKFNLEEIRLQDYIRARKVDIKPNRWITGGDRRGGNDFDSSDGGGRGDSWGGGGGGGDAFGDGGGDSWGGGGNDRRGGGGGGDAWGGGGDAFGDGGGGGGDAWGGGGGGGGDAFGDGGGDTWGSGSSNNRRGSDRRSRDSGFDNDFGGGSDFGDPFSSGGGGGRGGRGSGGGDVFESGDNYRSGGRGGGDAFDSGGDAFGGGGGGGDAWGGGGGGGGGGDAWGGGGGGGGGGDDAWGGGGGGGGGGNDFNDGGEWSSGGGGGGGSRGSDWGGGNEWDSGSSDSRRSSGGSRNNRRSSRDRGSSSGGGGGDAWGSSGGDAWGSSGSGGGDAWGSSGGSSGGGDAWGSSGGSGGGGDAWGSSGGTDFGGGGGGGDAWGSSGGSGGGGDAWGSSGSGDAWGGGDWSGSGRDSKNKGGKNEDKAPTLNIQATPYGILPLVGPVPSGTYTITAEELQKKEAPSSGAATPSRGAGIRIRTPMVTRTATQVTPRTIGGTPKLRLPSVASEGLSSPSLLASPDIFVNRQRVKYLETHSSSLPPPPPVVPVTLSKIIVSNPNGSSVNILDETQHVHSQQPVASPVIPPPTPVAPSARFTDMAMPSPLPSPIRPQLERTSSKSRRRDKAARLPTLWDAASDYRTSPPAESLRQMTSKELAHVHDFAVVRENVGSVRFHGETDIRGLDLPSLVVFDPPPRVSITVYPDGAGKPPVGQGINKPATITLLHVRAPASASKKRKFLERLRERKNSLYDEDKEIWSFDVDHFSRYGIPVSDDDDDDDEDDNDNDNHNNNNDDDDDENDEESGEFSEADDNEQLVDLSSSGHDEDSQEEEDDEDNEEEEEEDPIMPLTDRYDDDVYQNNEDEMVSVAQQLPGQRLFDPYTNLKMRAFQQAFRESDDDDDDDNEEVEPQLYESRRRRHANEALLPAELRDEQLFDQHATADQLYPGPFAQPKSAMDRRPAHVVSVPSYAPVRSVERPPIDHCAVVMANRLEEKRNECAERQRPEPIGQCDKHLRERSFRVGWSPHGVLALPTFCQVKLAHVADVVTSVPTDSQPYLALLQSHLQHSVIAPTPHGPAAGLHKQRVDANIVENIALCMNERQRVVAAQATEDADADDDRRQAELLHAQQIWQMVDSLWGRRHAGVVNQAPVELRLWCSLVEPTREDYVEGAARTLAVSRWLQACVADEVARDISSCEEAAERPYVYLTGRQVEEATREALEQSDVRLASIVAQALAHDIRDDVENQLRAWTASPMTDALRKIFRLLAGNVELLAAELQAASPRWSWQRSFGVAMWYAPTPSCHLVAAWERFGAAVRGSDDSDDSSVRQLTKDDTAFHLLGLYTQHSDVDDVLTPDGHTQCPLDFQHSWHLMSVLAGLGFAVELDLEMSVHAAFAAQLAHVGLWQWAVYVLLHAPASPQRERCLRELIARHASPGPRRSDEERFLVEQLHVPEQWLAEGKAWRARYDGNAKEEFRQLLKAADYSAAHRVLAGQILPRALILQANDVAIRLLARLERHAHAIQHWNEIGALFLQYLMYIEGVRRHTMHLEARPLLDLATRFQRSVDALPAYFSSKLQKLAMVGVFQELASRGQSLPLDDSSPDFYASPLVPKNELLTAVVNLIAKSTRH